MAAPRFASAVEIGGTAGSGTAGGIHVNSADIATGNALEVTAFGSTNINASINAVGSAYFKEQVKTDALFSATNGTSTPDAGQQLYYGINNSGATTFEVFADGRLDIGGTLPSAPNISLNANGSATFAGDVNAGGNTIYCAVMLQAFISTKTGM